MKYLFKLLWLFLPREGDDGGGDGGDGGDGGTGGGDGGDAGDDGAGGKDKAPTGGSDPEGKPDWLADKFWNPDLKAPRTEILGKSYNELQSKMQDKTETLKEEIRAEMIASAPEKYDVTLSDDLKIPDNIELDLTEEDPMVQWFFEKAKGKGMSQDEVTEWLNDYVKIELANLPDVAKEIEKLGDHGQDRMLRVHNWLESKLSDDQFKAMSPSLSRAVEIEALEVLMKSTGPADFDADTGGKALTLEELREMQNDPRAWQQKDPAFLKTISEGYKRLYANK